MTLYEIEHSPTSRLNKRLAELNRAVRGAQSHPNGMARLTTESFEPERQRLRAELSKRRKKGTSNAP